MRTAIFDLDGTLCNIKHRLHHVTDGCRDWEAFFEGIPADDLVVPVAAILEALRNDCTEIVLCSGRPEKCRPNTEAWLLDHEIFYSKLYMRPDNDTRPDHVVKREILDQILADGFEPLVVVDDRQSVVDMWRENGLICLQAAPDKEWHGAGLLTLMVGPSGAGKSTWLTTAAATEFGIHHSHVISSDQIRADLCGDWRDQTRNAEVFAAVHALAQSRIRHDLPAVIDATNLRRRDRMAAAGLTKGKVRYIVIDRPMDEKRRDAGWRAELPIDLLAKHQQTFDSQIREILDGDDIPNVEVIDLRAGVSG